jgi:hypothetical protein
METLHLVLIADNLTFLQILLPAGFFLLPITFRGGLDESVASSRHSLHMAMCTSTFISDPAEFSVPF